ncbi:MAG: hypothetical protein ACYS9Y_07630 [Planctomycetota bacterium]|jgi:hypothetical protein
MVKRRDFIKSVIGMTVFGVTSCSLSKSRKVSAIVLQPTDCRFVNIHHTGWDLMWRLQLPETVSCREGSFMTWPKINQEWIQQSRQCWYYKWRPTKEYVAQQQSYPHRDSQSNPIKIQFLTGLLVQPRIETYDNEVALTLTVHNESKKTFVDVRSDGGCFQARSTAFQNDNEAGRCYVIKDGKVANMKNLHRTKPIRCKYLVDVTEYEDKWLSRYEWFWGRSNDKIDYPTIVGAVSRDGSKAVALGYEHSTSAMQNGDGHHCLHSMPTFGDINPQATVTRKGYILFGNNLTALTNELRKRLT